MCRLLSHEQAKTRGCTWRSGHSAGCTMGGTERGEAGLGTESTLPFAAQQEVVTRLLLCQPQHGRGSGTREHDVGRVGARIVAKWAGCSL